MIKGHLSNYFSGIATKQLSAVETDHNVSHQHEFNGVNQLLLLLGKDEKIFRSKYIYIGVDENDTVSDEGQVTWYDARKNHPTRTEYRLYYENNPVMNLSSEGDTLLIGKTPEDHLLIIIIRAGSSMEQKVRWLFNLSEDSEQQEFQIQTIQNENDPDLNYASRLILSEMGIEIGDTDDHYLEIMLKKFDGKFPKTAEFSEFSRSTITGISAIEEPDEALINWLDREELLFRTLERYFVNQQLKIHFPDVDSFISYSLSIQNRRKSRAGFALENHLMDIFSVNRVTYSRNPVTENNAKPDFIFPGINSYKDNAFSNEKLTMLGVKSTCKDRWRQVLSEANRITEKHLLTLEPGISENQTNEMRSFNLQLVVPQPIHSSYKTSQVEWLMSLKNFIRLVKNRQ